MAETYSAGIVTAYGAAVRGGYTGTYEEFCAQQAAFAENAEQVAEDRAAVEQIKTTFENQTVPAAVQQVTQAGADQVQAVLAAGDAEESDIAAAGAAQETRVLQAGADQEAAVNAAGSTQVQAVQTAGAAQVTAVQGAGSTQVAAVNAAGTTQVDAVEDKGAEVLASIPQDYSALTGEVDDLKSAMSNVFPYREADGNPIMITDGAGGVPVKTLIAKIEFLQSGSGAPTPSNVRALSGIETLTLTVTGLESSHVYSVDFSEHGSIYGGTYDTVTGILTVNKLKKTFTGASSEFWQVHGGIASWFYINNAFDNAYLNNNESDYAVANIYSQYPYRDAVNTPNNHFSLGVVNTDQSQRLVVKDTRFTTVAAFKDALASKNLEIVYTLTQPITFNLTPVKVITFLGENTISSNANSLSVEYAVDINSYVPSGKTLYFATDGDDTNSGFSEQQPKKNFQSFLNGGYTILLKAGDSFYPPEGTTAGDGASLYNVGIGTSISSYGGVVRPKVSGRVDTDNVFSAEGSNVFSAPCSGNIGFLILGDKRLWKRKFVNSLSEDGEWFYDSENGKVYVYSLTSIAGETLSYSYGGNCFTVLGNNVSISGVEIEDFGVHGIEVKSAATDVFITANKIHNIGGGTLRVAQGSQRIGNGIQLWCEGLTNIVVSGNEVYNCYDAGLTPQIGSATVAKSTGLKFHKNYVHDCNYLFEMFCYSNEIELEVADNLFMNARDITNGYRDLPATPPTIVRIGNFQNANGVAEFSGNTGFGAENGYVIWNQNNANAYIGQISFDDVYATDGETKISYASAFPYPVNEILDVPSTPSNDKDYAILGYYLALAKTRLSN